MVHLSLASLSEYNDMMINQTLAFTIIIFSGKQLVVFINHFSKLNFNEKNNQLVLEPFTTPRIKNCCGLTKQHKKKVRVRVERSREQVLEICSKRPLFYY